MVMGHLPLRLMVTTVEFIGHMAHMLSHHSDNLGNSQCCIVLRVSDLNNKALLSQENKQCSVFLPMPTLLLRQ